MKKAIDYTTENPAYAEGRAMVKIAIVFVIVLVALSFL